MTEAPVLIERREAIEIVTLNRPERLNAMNEPLIDALFDASLVLAKQVLLAQTADATEARQAFRAKRPPHYSER